MKDFSIPYQLQSEFIAGIQEARNSADPKKKNWSPTLLQYQSLNFKLARHFGFCFGVKNAVEKVYEIAANHPNKAIYLISEMIHNPDVNADLAAAGIQFIQTEKGEQLIPWNQVAPDSIVITPAFGTTLDIQDLLKGKNISFESFDTTCPFVERVWKKGKKLQADHHTIILHAKVNHEETRATFSRLANNTVIVQDITEAQELAEAILNGTKWHLLDERTSAEFKEESAFQKVGVINQTTMLAEETQAIATLFERIIQQKNEQQKSTIEFTSTRDTLCYATNDNQKAAQELIQSGNDIAIVIGGTNSSNTSHLAEMFNQNCPTYYIRNQSDILSAEQINHFVEGVWKTSTNYMDDFEHPTIAISAGASCPNSIIQEVIQKILHFHSKNDEIHSAEIIF